MTTENENERPAIKYGEMISDCTRPKVSGRVSSIAPLWYVVRSGESKKRNIILKQNARKGRRKAVVRESWAVAVVPRKKRSRRSIVQEFGREQLRRMAVDDGVTVDQLIESMR